MQSAANGTPHYFGVQKIHKKRLECKIKSILHDDLIDDNNTIKNFLQYLELTRVYKRLWLLEPLITSKVVDATFK